MKTLLTQLLHSLTNLLAKSRFSKSLGNKLKKNEGRNAALKYSITMATLLTLGTVASANDGPIDVNNSYPAVGAMYLFAAHPDEVDWGGQLCSGSLITEKIFLTAAHCSAYYHAALGFPGQAGFTADVWVSFNVYATDNDFRCFLKDINFPNSEKLIGDLACVESDRSIPLPTFYKAVTAGITHPDFLKPTLDQNGTTQRFSKMLGNVTDVGVVLLEDPISSITPLATASAGFLDNKPELIGTPLLGVGYGLNFHKSIPAQPAPGFGPTQFLGENGIKRIANIGSIRTIRQYSIIPTQQTALGENAVCYGDSGSPVFLVQNGIVNTTVMGVLSGWALWCQGAMDPYSRVDTPAAISFLNCVKNAATNKAACQCGAENQFGLCEGL